MAGWKFFQDLMVYLPGNLKYFNAKFALSDWVEKQVCPPKKAICGFVGQFLPYSTSK